LVDGGAVEEARNNGVGLAMQENTNITDVVEEAR
jgi:hypothetical protein